MTGKYTNKLQAAILFEGGRPICPPLHLKAFMEDMAARDIPLRMPQENQAFALMIGPGDLYISVAYNNGPAQEAVFANTLRSAFTKRLMPDAAERVRRHTSHVLVEIWHGALGGVSDDEKIGNMLGELGMRPGHSLGEFNFRVHVLGEVIRHILQVQPASAVHWTQSNMLLAGDKIEAFLGQEHPSLLTVHPILVAGPPVEGFDELPVAVMTLGARDYIGREIYIPPVPVPWLDLYESAMAFLRLAIMPNGYVIPDGNTFGPESGEFSYRVRHCEGAESPVPDGGPCYELTLLFSKKHGYTAPGYQRGDVIEGGVEEAATMLDPDAEGSQECIADWVENEHKATAAGGSFKIYKPVDAPGGGNTPPRGGTGLFGGAGSFGKRTGTFGRKQ